MQQEVLIRNKFSDDDISFLIHKIDKILLHIETLKKNELIDLVLNLRDELDRFN